MSITQLRSKFNENTDPWNTNPRFKGTKTVNIAYQIEKEEAGSPCSQGISGPCNDISIDFTIGITPEDLPEFDDGFWGGGHIIDRNDKLKINNIPARFAYSYAESHDFPKSALFILSPKLQLRMKVTAYECKSTEC